MKSKYFIRMFKDFGRSDLNKNYILCYYGMILFYFDYSFVEDIGFKKK